MKQDRRDIFHMKFGIKITGFRGLTNYNFTRPVAHDVFVLIQNAFDNNLLKPMPYDKKREFFYIHKFEYDQTSKRVKMIVARSDRNASAPVFTNLATQSRDTRKLSEGEGLDYSAHVIFDVYQGIMLFENVININSARLESFFRHLFRQIKILNTNVFEQDHPTEDGVKVRSQIKFSLRGIVSDSLKDDIEEGKLNNITFIKEVNTGSADNHSFEEKHTALKVTPTRQGQGLFNDIGLLCKAKRNEYETAKINLITRGGQQATSTLRLDDSSIEGADATYFKKTVIKRITPVLDTSHNDFHPRITDVMLKEIQGYET